MKRSCVLILLTVSLFLSGCGITARSKKLMEDFSSQLQNAESISFSANIRAEYENKTSRFTLLYSGNGTQAAVTVQSPELIKGITAHISGGETKLSYDSVILDTGDLDSYGLSPMSALPIIIDAMKCGYWQSCRTENSCNVFELVPDDHTVCTVWFDGDMTPVRGELASDGKVRVYIDFLSWNVI